MRAWLARLWHKIRYTPEWCNIAHRSRWITTKEETFFHDREVWCPVCKATRFDPCQADRTW